MKGHCPVCGAEIPFDYKYAICHTCGWEDDPINRDIPDYNGINPVSLNEARVMWASGETIYPDFPNPKGNNKQAGHKPCFFNVRIWSRKKY